jgi:hypothetical protein
MKLEERKQEPNPSRAVHKFPDHRQVDRNDDESCQETESTNPSSSV